MICPVCGCARVQIVGYQGLGLRLACNDCGYHYVERREHDHSLDGLDPDAVVMPID